MDSWKYKYHLVQVTHQPPEEKQYSEFLKGIWKSKISLLFSGTMGSTKESIRKCSVSLETVYKFTLIHSNPWNNLFNASYSSWLLLEMAWPLRVKSSPLVLILASSSTSPQYCKTFHIRNSCSTSQTSVLFHH